MILVPGTPGHLVVKSKLCPRSGFITLKQLNPIKLFKKKKKKVLIYCAYSEFGKMLQIQRIHSENFGNEILCKRIINTLRKV